MTTPRKKLQTAAHRVHAVAARAAVAKLRAYIKNPGFQYDPDSMLYVSNLDRLLDEGAMRLDAISKGNEMLGRMAEVLMDEIGTKWKTKMLSVLNRIQDKGDRDQWKRTVGTYFNTIQGHLSEALAAFSSNNTAPRVGNEFARAARQLVSVSDRLSALARKAVDRQVRSVLFDAADAVGDAYASIPKTFSDHSGIERALGTLTTRLGFIRRALTKVPEHPEIPSIIKLLTAIEDRLWAAYTD